MKKSYKRVLWALIVINAVAVVAGFTLRARKLSKEEESAMQYAERYAQGIEDLGELKRASAFEGLRICYRADRDGKISDSDFDKLTSLVDEACKNSEQCHPFLILPLNEQVLLKGSEYQRTKAAQLYANIAHKSKDSGTREHALRCIAMSRLPAHALISDLVRDPSPKISKYAAKVLLSIR